VAHALIAVALAAIWSPFAIRARHRRSIVADGRWRAAFTLAVAATAGVIVWIFWSTPRPIHSDVAPVWAGARALLRGRDPYASVGPGRWFDTKFPLMYPMTAVLTMTPLAFASMHWADLLFCAIGCCLFIWAVTTDGRLPPAVVALVSLPALMTLQTGQWSLLLTGAALLPAAGFLLIAKPTIGLALFGAFPCWRTAVGCGVLLAASVAVSPGWIAEWRAGFVTVPHIVAPITRWGGPLVLLALTKWKRADARLLLGLACVPHTTALYETIPLFLIAETWLQAWAIWALAVGVYVGQWATGPYASIDAQWNAGAQWIVAIMYLPCLAMVLWRPNEWSLRLPRREGRRRIDAELPVVGELDGRAAAHDGDEPEASADRVARGGGQPGFVVHLAALERRLRTLVQARQ
jgi:hypothetical protein